MRIDDLRARVQPSLEQDFDALYEEFVDETGERALVPFLDHLRGFGLIPDGLYDELVQDGVLVGAPVPSAPPTPAPHLDDPDEEEEQTVIANDDVLALIDPPQAVEAGGASAAGGGPADELSDDATFEIEPPTDAPTDSTTEPPQGSLAGLRTPEDAPRRTMFRRLSDGELKETGVQEIEQRNERRRRRRQAGDSTDARRRRRQAEGTPDRYQFVGIVGEGAMGRVHLAQDLTLHRKVAYKAMSEEIAQQSTLASKFTAEAQITAQLDHPNIVPVYALEGDAAYTMKLIDGKTLEDVISETRELATAGRPLDEEHSLETRLELFLRACDAMAYAHSRGVVHRDLKPENIMVGAFGELYVMDWGIARVMSGTFANAVELGAEQEDEGDLVIGTPGYMSPEQAEGLNEELDGRSDQYALGLILFELLTLAPAVTGKAPLKIVMRHQDGEKDPFRHIKGEKIAPELAAIVDKATAKSREARYPDVKAMADDVRRYLRGEAVLARPDPLSQKLLRWVGRHRELTLVAMFLVFIASSTLVLSVIVYSQLALAAQQAREQQFSNLLTTVAKQSSLIDGQILKYEGLLSVIATSAVDNLFERAPEGEPVFLAADYDDPERQPEGLIDSSRYGMPVSIEHAAFVLADPERAEVLSNDMARLAELEKHFYRVLLRSHSEVAATYTPKRAERALTEVGVPVAWAYVGLDNGVYSVFPGHGDFPDRFDHRESPWYALAKGSHGPTWGAPSLDQAGIGLVLTCAQALYSDDDVFLGVAGIDVTFDHIIEELLEAPEFKGSEGVEAFLLDPEGRIAVRSSKKGKEFKGALRNRTIRMPDFHHPEVVEAVKEKRSGALRARGPEGPELVVYNRMNSIGWYYVVAGDQDELLASGD